jgi:hypothetical protein
MRVIWVKEGSYRKWCRKGYATVTAIMWEIWQGQRCDGNQAVVRDDASSRQLFARARQLRNSGADRPHAHLGSEAALSVPPHGVHLKHCLRTLRPSKS